MIPTTGVTWFLPTKPIGEDEFTLYQPACQLLLLSAIYWNTATKKELATKGVSASPQDKLPENSIPTALQEIVCQLLYPTDCYDK